MLDERSSLILFLSIIMIISLIFNTFSIYSFKRIQNKISAHYICLNINIINLFFTLISIPSYILKEANIIHNDEIASLLAFLDDFIKFVYNDLVLLIALDRYFFICTQIRFNGKLIILIYYSLSVLIASASVSRLFENSFKADNNTFIFNESFWIYGKYLTEFYTKYYVFTVIMMDITLELISYFKILLYVYRKSSHARSYLPIIVVNFGKRVNKHYLCVNGNNQELSSHSSHENIKVSNMFGEKNTSECRKIKRKYNYNMIHFQIFKKTYHWIITKVFIRVNKNFIFNYVLILF